LKKFYPLFISPSTFVDCQKNASKKSSKSSSQFKEKEKKSTKNDNKFYSFAVLKKASIMMKMDDILTTYNVSSLIYGAFARLSASDLGLMQTFGPFKLCLSNTSESRVK